MVGLNPVSGLLKFHPESCPFLKGILAARLGCAASPGINLPPPGVTALAFLLGSGSGVGTLDTGDTGQRRWGCRPEGLNPPQPRLRAASEGEAPGEAEISEHRQRVGLAAPQVG